MLKTCNTRALEFFLIIRKSAPNVSSNSRFQNICRCLLGHFFLFCSMPAWTLSKIRFCCGGPCRTLKTLLLSCFGSCSLLHWSSLTPVPTFLACANFSCLCMQHEVLRFYYLPPHKTGLSARSEVRSERIYLLLC